MITRIIVGLSILVFVLAFFNTSALAHDTDLYVLDQSMEQVPPDILIILDLSGSMRYTPAGEYMFIPDTTSCTNPSDSDSYCRTSHCSKNCASGTPFYNTSATGHTRQCRIDIDSGHETPTYTWPKYGSTSCAGPYYKTYSGSDSTRNTDCSKVAIAKRAIKNILDDNKDGSVTDPADQDSLNIRMGYMRFYGCGSDSGSDYNSGCNTLRKGINTAYSQVWTAVNGENAYGGTPLASALKEAKLYLDAHKSGDDAKLCRKKFAILITDGQDTLACSGSGNDWQGDQYKRRRETIAQAKALSSAGYMTFVVGFGGDMPYFLKNTLNWAAYYGGVDNPAVDNSGNVNGYPIPYGLYPSGIASCQTSTRTCYVYKDLIKTPSVKTSCSADTSGCYCYTTSSDPGEASLSGYAFLAADAYQLNDALDAIRNYIIAILAKSTSYVAPVVPISQMVQTDSESRMYLGMFKPTATSFWKGNIKKFGIAVTPSEGIDEGDIIDAKSPAELVIDAQNRIKDTSKSYWSSAVDGGEVLKGGVGEILQSRDFVSSPRKLYTNLGTSSNLTDSSNAFSLSNAAITPTMLGFATGDTTERNKIINFLYGYDAYDENKNGITNEKRTSLLEDSGTGHAILGAIIHSRPLVIYYKNLSRTVIYVGANDGMFHAFDDQTGEELWGFVPPSLLPGLKKFRDDLSLQIFVDGSPQAYVQKDGSGTVLSAIVIFGLRRGGNRYLALDVTNPLSPRFLWEVSPSVTGYGELGQTWSTPRLSKIKYGAGEKWVVIVGGGYDENQDNIPVTAADTKGRALFVIDALTGSQIWKYSHSENSDMSYSIPSDIARVDTNGDGYVDRLYAGDMGGKIWRFNIGDPNPANWTGKKIFQAAGKIFNPPDVTLEKDEGNYEMLFFGTGDREDPKDTDTVSKLYAVKDKNPSSALGEADLVDVTQDLLQAVGTTDPEKSAILDQLKQKKGWYITLNQGAGEKCLAGAVAFAGDIYYTTFTPTLNTSSNICTVGDGVARLYILNFKTGVAAFNLDASNDLVGTPVITGSDRSMVVGAGIPSGTIFAVSKGTVTAYGGVGGGIFSPPLPQTKSLIPVNWRVVF